MENIKYIQDNDVRYIFGMTKQTNWSDIRPTSSVRLRTRDHDKRP